MNINDQLINGNNLTKQTQITFPRDVLKWMKKNAKPRMAIKLMQICKYFQHQEFPFYVIKQLFCDEELIRYHTLDGRRYDKQTLEDITDKRIWICDALTIISPLEISQFLSKVAVCDVKILNIVGQICLEFNQFKFLTDGGNIEKIGLTSTKILEKDGNVASLEEIFECLPNAQTIQIYGEVPPLLSSTTNAKTIPPTKLQIIDFREISERIFDFEKFLIFIIENQQIEYFLHFEDSASFNYCKKFQKVIHEITETWTSSSKKPEIIFPYSLKELETGIILPRNHYCKDNRKKHLSKSVFTLIYPNTKSFQQRFFEALEAGAIPVILSLASPLPFEEFIDWRKAVYRIPISRLPELHFILRSISLADILEYQRKGRFFFESYLHNTDVFVKTLISFMRYRLQMPITEDKAVKAKPLFQVKENPSNTSEMFSFFPPILTSNFTRSPLDNEFLGPFEAPFPSKAFTHNFTIFGMYAYKIWNDLPYLTDYTPQFLMEEISMPSEAEFFRQTNSDMRPITSGSGKEFSKALGGNRPNEQFTIVIVTYNRDETLKYQLQGLHDIPFLNRIIVIWNNIERDPPLSWPKLNIPVYFVKAEKNSLNNRFIPYDLIKTEAVLSLDDDLKIMRHEIVFAFRVWRQERNKIVGFPARYHYQNNGSIFYNSNHTCQYSMILTGAAFLHKNYLYAYTFGLPKSIHQKIDEYINCKDIAMNFLVAHLTRQPPIKVGNEWSTLCPDGTLRGSNKCPDSLSTNEEHYEKRHKCIKFFTKVFGYNPLLFSQYRVNSVLFWSKDLPKHH